MEDDGPPRGGVEIDLPPIGGVEIDCQKEGWRLAARRGGRGLYDCTSVLALKQVLIGVYL